MVNLSLDGCLRLELSGATNQRCHQPAAQTYVMVKLEPLRDKDVVEFLRPWFFYDWCHWVNLFCGTKGPGYLRMDRL